MMLEHWSIIDAQILIIDAGEVIDMGDWVPGVGSLPKLSAIERRVLDAIDEQAVIDFHAGLVRIPSVNPPGDVRDAISYCEGPLADAGFATEIVAEDETMPSLIATTGNGDGPTLAFNAHVDVVPIGERSAWSFDPFGAEIHDGRIYGRGAGDDKASVTAQVMAALALVRSGVPIKGTLIVNEVSDEESGGFHGAKYVTDHDFFTPDFVIVGEQTMNEVALGEKGASPTVITVRGRTAHGALPWEGANAIEAMAEIIVALRGEYWPAIGKRSNPFFHPSSGSVNMFSGGIKTNVVPDFAEIYIDRRLVPGEVPATVVREIEAIAKQAVAEMPGITVDVVEKWSGTPATMMPEDSPLVLAMTGANDRLGLSTSLRGFSMATDGRYFANKGIPTIIYGPGDPRLAHIPDEWVGVDELLWATRAYALAAVSMLT
jgi:acetylornithine deacetylase/succinyl-diaminopimelate desuccinylase family protein